MLTGYIKSLPIELEKAAYMEGNNAFRTFFKVVVLLKNPSFATVAIFSFLWSYNDLFTQMFFLRNKKFWAITRLMQMLTSKEGTNYGLMASTVSLVVIPVIIVYIFLQKYEHPLITGGVPFCAIIRNIGDGGFFMYKVVIIDDEPIIVEGLSKLLTWEQYHCKIAATACNGKEGLEVIRRERPDILFSDICMPGLDGLSMIAALKVEFPDMEISILTGFREFDYCQKAIRLGVSRFLLKPSNMAELEEALEAMTERLSKKAITGKQNEYRNTKL